MNATGGKRRRRRAVVVLLVSCLVAVGLDAAHAAPAVTIRVPQVAQVGQVPPAIVGGGVPGQSYVVHDAATWSVVKSGTLQVVDGPAAPWGSAALAPLGDLGTGSFVVETGGVLSGGFAVTSTAYADVVESLLDVFHANADGDEPAWGYHRDSHLNDARSTIKNGPHAGERVDVEGGWMDAGDQLKFTLTTAYSTLLLDLAARNEAGLAGELRSAAGIGVRWLLKAHPRSGVFVSMVGSVSADHNTGFRDPAGDDGSSVDALRRRPTFVLTGSTGGSDVAALASAALATRAAQVGPGSYRDKLVRHAKAWLAQAVQLGEVWHNCCYPGSSFHDDLAVARAALWRATGRTSYAADAVASLKRATADGDKGWLVGADGYEMAGIAAAELCGVLGAKAAPATYRDPGCRILRSGGENWSWVVGDESAFGQAGASQWGSARQNASGGAVLELAHRAGLASRAAALRSAGWFLGVNPWGLRWQVGSGPQHPHHWASIFGSGSPWGAVVGGPAPTTEYANMGMTAPQGTYDTARAAYQDVVADYIANEVGISYNAPVVLQFALLSPG